MFNCEKADQHVKKPLVHINKQQIWKHITVLQIQDPGLFSMHFKQRGKI
jgi:hypothetical protein